MSRGSGDVEVAHVCCGTAAACESLGQRGVGIEGGSGLQMIKGQQKSKWSRQKTAESCEEKATFGKSIVEKVS